MAAPAYQLHDVLAASGQTLKNDLAATAILAHTMRLMLSRGDDRLAILEIADELIQRIKDVDASHRAAFGDLLAALNHGPASANGSNDASNGASGG